MKHVSARNTCPDHVDHEEHANGIIGAQAIGPSSRSFRQSQAPIRSAVVERLPSEVGTVSIAVFLNRIGVTRKQNRDIGTANEDMQVAMHVVHGAQWPDVAIAKHLFDRGLIRTAIRVHVDKLA